MITERKIEIFQKSFPEFLKFGAKTLTMDSISSLCGISKKTLYEEFASKEVLLEEMLDYILNTIRERVLFIQSKNYPAIDEMFLVQDAIREFKECDSEVFTAQLFQYYNKIHRAHTQRIFETINELTRKNLVKGIEEGVYRKDLDIDISLVLFMALTVSIEVNPEIKKRIKHHHKINDYALLFFLRAISSEKGLQYLENLQHEKNN